MTTLLAPPESLSHELVDDLRRREFLAVLAAAGLVAGCGAGSGSEADAAPATRTVVDDQGRSVDIPAQPQRVVFLEEESAAHVTTLGYVPLAVAWYYGPDVVERLTAFGGRTGDLGDVQGAGPLDELDTERIATLAPDLMIGGFSLDDATIERLSRIAPVLAVKPRENRDGEQFAQQRFLADIVGLGEVAEEQIGAYEVALADVRTRHAAVLPGLQYTYLDTGDEGVVDAYNTPTFAVNAVMADLGIPMSDAVRQATDEGIGYDDGSSGYAQLSVEVAADYDASLLFLGRYDDLPVDAQLLTVLSTTFAARNDQLFRVDANRWTFHLLQADLEVLDQLDGFFTDQTIEAIPS